MTPTLHDDRIEFIPHGDADGWIEAVAAEMAQTLNHDINEVGRARILLSGGTTPAPVYQALAELDVHWDRVEVSLADERWLSPQDRDSNAWLVRENLLKRAEGAHFDPLVRIGKPCPNAYTPPTCRPSTASRRAWWHWAWATTATPPRCSRARRTWPAHWKAPCPMPRWTPPAALGRTSGHCASP